MSFMLTPSLSATPPCAVPLMSSLSSYSVSPNREAASYTLTPGLLCFVVSPEAYLSSCDYAIPSVWCSRCTSGWTIPATDELRWRQVLLQRDEVVEELRSTRTQNRSHPWSGNREARQE